MKNIIILEDTGIFSSSIKGYKINPIQLRHPQRESYTQLCCTKILVTIYESIHHRNKNFNITILNGWKKLNNLILKVYYLIKTMVKIHIGVKINRRNNLDLQNRAIYETYKILTLKEE